MEQLQSEMEPTPLNILKIQTTQWIIHMIRIILWFSKLTRWTSLKLRKLIWKIKLVESKNEIIFVKFVEIVLHLNRSFSTILMPVRANESGNIWMKLKFWMNFDNNKGVPTFECLLNWPNFGQEWPILKIIWKLVTFMFATCDRVGHSNVGAPMIADFQMRFIPGS